MIRAKNIVLGVSGGIAAYKSCEIVSSLVKLGAGVDVIMTANAEHFVTPLTFETLSGRTGRKRHVRREERVRCPPCFACKESGYPRRRSRATADVIAKFARGIADDMLSHRMARRKVPAHGVSPQ